ncbi:hypothetical protein [Aeromonas sp. Y311-2]|uniref:hypothetical protein n=1 Tax=Aeromonas sp. Y311-2 TaxID=2990507 RepID=UPI0022E80CBA|nr:hypothetical protein [Aeromonas sp. Y311-2]
MTRSQIVAILSRYPFLETSQALEMLADSQDEALCMQEVLAIWDRVSTCLDHHETDDRSGELRRLENELAAKGTFRVLDVSE